MDEFDFDAICYLCDTEFGANYWYDGECPNPECDNTYYWEEDCLGDYSDCWPVLYWEKWR